MRPASHHVLDSVIATFDSFIVPELDDEYAQSLGKTIGQLLRSVRERILHEPEALFEDNADLEATLAAMRGDLSDEVRAMVDAALDEAVIAPGVYPSTERLMVRADALRAGLVAVIEATADGDDPSRVAAREYLRRQLDRQAPWLIDAWTGPRR